MPVDMIKDVEEINPNIKRIKASSPFKEINEKVYEWIQKCN